MRFHCFAVGALALATAGCTRVVQKTEPATSSTATERTTISQPQSATTETQNVRTF